MTEAQFQEAVVQLAQLTGWLVYHTFDSRRSQAGYPDLTLVKGRRLVFAELKSQAGRVSAEQQQWLGALREANPASVFVWRPQDWDAIETLLKGDY